MANEVQKPEAVRKLTRGAGLPKSSSGDHFFAFDQQGNVWALQWSKDHEAWLGVGFEGSMMMPATRIFKGAAENLIASHVSVPVHLVEAA